ncbi:MAG: CDP-alcohol phosphatidyltransferase family protein [Candidatus Wallbacteria bacterium]|nr:CDP-alcohol phosphatidyltransferase family protein [Candidatus Wallbacteria bacterium]
MFIVDFTIADYLTLMGHLLVWTGLWCALAMKVELALAALTLAMLLDALDGKVARSLGVARPFGRYLGSFVDLVNYTVCPPLVLHALGYRGWLAAAAMFIFSTCGLLRLARFNEVGNIQDSRGELAYLGLPVFWIHFILALLYAIRWAAGPAAFHAAATVSLPALGFCFVLDRPFWKPQSYAVIAATTVAMAILFLWLGLR